MTKVLCMVLVVSLAFSSLMIAVPTDSGTVVPGISALTPHAPIRIDSNTDFPGNASSGDGSILNPWIIENLTINGTGYGNCIHVGNTTDYFIVRNCMLHNASGVVSSIYNINAAMMLYNVRNGTVQNNTITNSSFGIYLYNNSINNTITQNMAFNNSDSGIMIDNGPIGNELIDNSAYNNGVHGIYIYKSDVNTLTNNKMHHNGNSGIYINSANSNQVFNNTIHNNTVAGVHIYSLSMGNGIKNNKIADNGYGIRIYTSMPTSTYNVIYHNNFINNTNHAYDNTNFTFWDWGYQWGGNYWDDYSGIDLMNGPNQDIPGSDGFGDAHYTNIDGGTGANDSYPLMTPYPNLPPGDSVPPKAMDWGPVGNSTEQAAKIFIQWNESMNWTSVEDAFTYTDGMTNWTSSNGTWVHDLTFNSTFTPAVPFAYEAQYWVTVNCTAKDFAGNMLDQNMSGTGGEWPSDVLAWNFTVTDQAPSVISTIPANGQIDVDPYKPIKIVFSEAMNRTSVENGFSYTNGTHTWNLNDGVVYWNAFQTEFTFSPVFSLELNQTFTAMLNGSLARDLGGKLLAGGNYSWSFTTWLEPPAPHVIDTYPPPGAINVNVNTYINVGFDSEMTISSLDGAFSYTDGTDVWGVADGTVDWFSDNTLFSFQPTEKLNYDSTYTVRIRSNATSIYDKHLDGNDNGIPDVNDDYVFVFTTTPEPPVVESHYPEANQMGVPITLPAVYINFTKLMDITSVTNAVSIYPNTAFTQSFSGGGKSLSLVLVGELLVGTQYRITVLGTAMDLAGIKLDGNNDGWAGDKFTFSFSTAVPEEPIMPQIVSIFPLNNATIPIEPFYVMITFNVVMNRTSVQNAFKFKNETDYLNGTYEWSVSGKAFRFMPDTVLEYNTTYFVSLQGTAADLNGVPLGNSTNWQYVTEAAPATTSYGDWIMYGIIIFLAVMVIVLYMANHSLRKDLKRTRVKLKRLKREMGVEDKPTEPEKPPEGEEIIDEELPEEPAEEIQPETEEIIDE